MRKWLLVLAAVVGLGAALVVWFAAEDARQAAALDARIWEVSNRVEQAVARENRLRRDGAPAEEVLQAERETEQSVLEAGALNFQKCWLQQPWHVRLRAEVRRRTGW